MKSNQKEKIQAVLNQLIDCFKSGKFPAIAKRVFIQKAAADHGTDKPSKNWSCNNVLIMLLSGSEDARTYQQWASVGRQVRKGEKSFSILGPSTKTIYVTVKDKDTGEEQKEKRQIALGFHPIPVFDYHQTDGEPIYYDYTPPVLPPLHNVAIHWGMSVIYLPFTGRELGSFSQHTNTIRLKTVEPDVFYHELAHKSHCMISNGLEPGQHSDQEIVAEMAAACLCSIFSSEEARPLDTWRYIQHYSEGSPEVALKNIFSLLNEVAAVVGLIMETAEQLNVVSEEKQAV